MPAPSNSVSVKRADNGFVVTSWDEKTGRERTLIAKDKNELSGMLTQVGL